ncbi:MAG TPA: DUF92 domain-containing protein [Candidatus Polarisedimenticolia bacterium]
METSERSRKLVHAGAGALAFLLRDLEPWQAIGCALVAVFFNRFVLRALGGGRLFRGDERRHPWSSGIVIYPFSVLLLLVLFRNRMEVAAAAWGVLAAGDAAAGAFGRWRGRRALPWNHRKTMEGSVAFAIAAGVAAAVLLIWMGRPPLQATALAIPTALFAAVIESLPWRLDDNLTVPLLAALFLRGLLEVRPAALRAAAPELGGALLWGAALNLLLGIIARRLGTVDRSGMIAGVVIGSLTWTFLGWRGFLMLAIFFALGSACTRVGYRHKAGAGIAQEKKGARSAAHAIANCAVAVFFALLVVSAAAPAPFLIGFVCAYATAAFDTVSSEIGQAYGGRPILITTLRSVPTGTDGAISWTGTFAGLLAAAVVAGSARATGLIGPGVPGLVLAAAFLGATADSFLGATLERRGLMDNHAVNFSNTLVGALAGVGLAALAYPAS